VRLYEPTRTSGDVACAALRGRRPLQRAAVITPARPATRAAGARSDPAFLRSPGSRTSVAAAGRVAAAPPRIVAVRPASARRCDDTAAPARETARAGAAGSDPARQGRAAAPPRARTGRRPRGPPERALPGGPRRP